MSDVLLIARWCWPEHGWHDVGQNRAERDDSDSYCAEFFDLDELEDVRAAELIIIGRGLLREYEATIDQIVLKESSCRNFPDWDFYATVATASLDVRVRAIATAIRGQEKTK
jgi:hypothetical protein